VMPRTARIERNAAETQIQLELNTACSTSP
jgi:imidazoleglycerol phosphate dehydratase HisB